MNTFKVNYANLDDVRKFADELARSSQETQYVVKYPGRANYQITMQRDAAVSEGASVVYYVAPANKGPFGLGVLPKVRGLVAPPSKNYWPKAPHRAAEVVAQDYDRLAAACRNALAELQGEARASYLPEYVEGPNGEAVRAGNPREAVNAIFDAIDSIQKALETSVRQAKVLREIGRRGG